MSVPGGIRLESVARDYDTAAGVVHALEDVTLSVPAGTSLAVMGPSGCGKSTLLGLAGGLAPPSRGRVWIGAQEVSAMREARRARMRRHVIGFVFQADNLQPFLTAEENVALRLAMAGELDDRGRCRELLAQLGLAAQAQKLPDQLSGGERQRVAVAQALIHRPSVILADEPTGALDAGNSRTVIEVLLLANRELGATLVVVTHDHAVGSRLDRVVSLRDGRLCEAMSARAG